MKTLAGLAFLLCVVLPAGQAFAQVAPPVHVNASSLMEHIHYIEAHIKLPPEAGTLASYDRYYAFDDEIPNAVAGYYVGRADVPEYKTHGDSPEPGIYLVPYRELPEFIDGICRTNISIGYSIESREITYACRGHFPPPPPK